MPQSPVPGEGSAQPVPLFPGGFQQNSVGQTGLSPGTECRGVGWGKSGGPCEDSIMLAVKRLIRIEFSIDVKLPFTPAAGVLITGSLFWGII